MTPQEQQLITELFARLKQTPAQAKDAVADQLIRRGLTDNPEAPYRLVQTVLIQEMALSQAQHRVTELENRPDAESSASSPQPATSFLGDPVSRGDMPPAGPGGRAPQPAAPTAQAAAPSGFLRAAAATALGVVGGHMLFQGIESMFGQHAGSILSGQSIQPALSETVVNNFYGDQPTSAEPSSDDSDAQDAEEDPSDTDDNPEQGDSFADGDTDLS